MYYFYNHKANYILTAVAIYKGYGFIQFDREDDARNSVAQEHGGMIKGQRVGE